MNRRSLEWIAAILITLMVVVATAGLDHLPREMREAVAAANRHMLTDRAAFEQNKAPIERAIREQPTLFGTKDAAWRERLSSDQSRLQAAARDLNSLQQLAKANRRTDANQVETTLRDFDSLRTSAISDQSEIRAEAERWLTYKRELPKRLESMRTSYEAVTELDLDVTLAPVQKAMLDWPLKRNDLQARIDSLKQVQIEAGQIWRSSEPLRSAAVADRLTGADYPTLFSDADRLDAAGRQLRDSAASLNTLAAQLYGSWDKVLVDVDNERGHREKLRVIRTRFPDATLANGQTTTEENWEPVDSARFRDAERNIGMTVEHKAAGKYDSESDHLVQPPAYAYIAPPGQSNAYGGWSAGVWHWLPEYLILNHLLHGSRGPITAGDFGAYQGARRRGEIFYGRNNEYRPRAGLGLSGGIGSVFSRSAPPISSGSQSSTGWYKERPKPSWGDSRFNGSKYESRGAFSGSRYQSRGTFGARSYSRGGGGFRSFGRGGRR